MSETSRRFLTVLAVAAAGLLVANGVRGCQPTPAKNWPYKFVASETDQTSNQNVMDLYVFDGAIDPAELRAFCRERKDKSPAKMFYTVVIFDKASHARFPSTPFTGVYGEWDGSDMKHIRAAYVYNKVNGYSELEYHDKNQHKLTREKI